eukprot:10681979-Heterocapsa_arctica.AAC.1
MGGRKALVAVARANRLAQAYPAERQLTQSVQGRCPHRTARCTTAAQHRQVEEAAAQQLTTGR